MPDQKDNVLDKAEGLARRILERLGSKVDDKLAPAKGQTFSVHFIEELGSRIERVIDSNLQEDENGVRKVAPNKFSVLFTYEETSAISPQYIEAVSKELTAGVFEFINNRRYVTRGKVQVQAARDLFAKTTTVKASFDDTIEKTPAAPGAQSTPQREKQTSIWLAGADGRNYRVDLTAQGVPAYIGRASGNAVRIDDPSISRLHCSLSLRPDGSIVIGDLGSANGTSVNDQLLARDEARAVGAGDTIRVGDFVLSVSEVF